MIKCNSPCCSSTMHPLTDLATESVHQTLPTALSYYASVWKSTECISALILSYGRQAQRVVMQIIPSFRIRCSRSRTGPVQPKPKLPLSSAVLRGWRMCSLVQIWACNSQQNLGLLLISSVLALTGLTLRRPLRLPSRPKIGMLYPKYFRGRPTLQFFCFWLLNPIAVERIESQTGLL